MKVSNFGRNVSFTPSQYHEPTTEEELISVLESNRTGQVRVVGSAHSWSDAIVTDDVVISLKNFNSVEIRKSGEGFSVLVGGGCQIKHLLKALQKEGLTLPTIGLITEQTIAGATATGTHGSGKQCLSHFIKSARIACFHEDANGSAAIRHVTDGDDLRAAKCHLGCLGVVVQVELPCVQQYNIMERIRACNTFEEALSSEPESPLQQSFLLPHRWKYLVQERSISDRPRSWLAPLYRLYWWLGLDLLFHLIMLLFSRIFRSRRLIHFLYKYLLPPFVIRNWKVVDRSDKILVMEHETFRHLELEAFIDNEKIIEATGFVELVLRQCDGLSVAELSEPLKEKLKRANLLADFEKLENVYTHHYPICIRKILKDKTLISMASGDAECWYAISFITYSRNRESFYLFATFLAKALLHLFDGRIHWGKWFPLDENDVKQMYPEAELFRDVCQRFDPEKVFQNRFTRIICQPDLNPS